MNKESNTYTFMCGYGKEDEVMSFGRGLTTSFVYVNWINMHNRCYSPNDMQYERYGGVGITVCDEWNYKNEYGLLNFICWSLCGRNRYNPNIFQSIHRIDNNVGYCPENCMWADNRIQNSNKSTNRYVNFFGRTITMSELAKNFGIPVSTIKTRIYNNWNMDETIQIPGSDRMYEISYYRDRSNGLIVYHDSLVRPLYYADYDPNDPDNWYGNYYWHELLIKRGVIPCEDLPVECIFPKEAPRWDKGRNKDFKHNSTYFDKFQDK